MIHEIKKQVSLDLSGYVIKTSLENGENFNQIPKFWADVNKDGRLQNLLPFADDMGVLGIVYGYDPKTKTMSYMIGVNHQVTAIEGLESISFPPMDYAAFEAKGPLPDSIKELMPKLQVFMKSSNLTYGDGPELEVYPQGDMSSQNYVCYYWLPIQ